MGGWVISCLVACSSDPTPSPWPSSGGGTAPASGGDPGSGGRSAGDGGSSAGGAAGSGASAGGGAGETGSGGAESLPGYYVATDGDDANPGTIDAPFGTLQKARDAVRADNDDMTEDIHVYVRGGLYRVNSTLTFEVEDSGTNGHRIYYEAYPGETPVVSGSVRVTDWTPHQGPIYKAPLERSRKLRNLYVNDQRAMMASQRVTSQGGSGTYSVTSGQADWAWTSGTASDGVAYSASDVPLIANNRDDLEIVNATTWNENIVCTRDVITATNGARVLLLQQPYGAIAQQPGWNSGFRPTGAHIVFNALEFLDEPGEFFFDKTEQTLYYYPRQGEDMATTLVEAPQVHTLIDVRGTSTSERVSNITFQGITFENTDYDLHETAGSRGKASVQAATVFTAFLAGGDWHSTKYDILDTFPGVIMINSAQSIEVLRSVIKHSGSEGISLINDVRDSTIAGNVITDIAGSGMTVGHPQHVYIGDGGERAKYTPAVEGACTAISIVNNLVYSTSTLPGFGGHSGITAFYPDGVKIEHNQIQLTAYNGVSLGWGWRNFKDSTTCRDSSVSFNRFIDTLSRLHDSGAIYTIGQMPGTTINENYVRGIPPATSGPTYGLHNDEGTAHIVENDNVLDIDHDVHYTINCEDFGEKHDLTILRTYATVNKMGANPPASTIDPPVVVADAVWPRPQYEVCLDAGIEAAHQHIVPASLSSPADQVFPASVAVRAGEPALRVRSSVDAHALWFAPEGTTVFSAGPTMTRAAGSASSLPIPAQLGNYKLYVLDADDQVLDQSAAILRVE